MDDRRQHTGWCEESPAHAAASTTSPRRIGCVGRGWGLDASAGVGVGGFVCLGGWGGGCVCALPVDGVQFSALKLCVHCERLARWPLRGTLSSQHNSSGSSTAACVSACVSAAGRARPPSNTPAFQRRNTTAFQRRATHACTPFVVTAGTQQGPPKNRDAPADADAELLEGVGSNTGEGRAKGGVSACRLLECWLLETWAFSLVMSLNG